MRKANLDAPLMHAERESAIDANPGLDNYYKHNDDTGILASVTVDAGRRTPGRSIPAHITGELKVRIKKGSG